MLCFVCLYLFWMLAHIFGSKRLRRRFAELFTVYFLARLGATMVRARAMRVQPLPPMRRLKAVKAKLPAKKVFTIRKAVKAKLSSTWTPKQLKRVVMVHLPCAKLDDLYLPATIGELYSKNPPVAYSQVLGMRVKTKLKFDENGEPLIKAMKAMKAMRSMRAMRR